MKTRALLFICLLFNCFWLNLTAQSTINYDELKVPEYVLPDVLRMQNGNRVKTIEEWINLRRPEILKLFKQEIYGQIPRSIQITDFTIVERSNTALKEKAIRKQVKLTVDNQGKTLEINILIYLPREIENPHIFLGYNFYGNQTITDDPAILITDSWVKDSDTIGTSNNKATEDTRGKRHHRWPVETIIDNGFGLATIYYGDVDPDKDDFTDGVHALLYESGQTKPAAHEWGAIAAWAWGLSKAMDYIQMDTHCKDSKVIVMGHSRLGKTSLWAGAVDERFDLVISNNSGSGGAALFRRSYGETAAVLNTNFPHWFCDNFTAYSNNESSLPIDQHMLISLIAPRPVYIASAVEDRWADPKGEYLSGYHAGPVYQLFGKEVLTNPEPPTVNTPRHTSIGYHMRDGGHDVKDYDWEQFIKFAKTHLK